MKKIIVLAGLLVATALLSSAATCVSGDSIITATMGNGTLFTSGYNCSLGGFTFSNFAIVGTAFPNGTVVNISLSTNTGIVGGLPELDFQIGGTAGGLGEDLRFYYQITPGADGIILSVAGSGSSITETVCSVTFAGTTTCPQANVLGNGGASSNQTVTIPLIHAATDFVFKDISVGNGISDFTQTFTPEPMTMTLMGAGLLGLGLLRRRQVRK